MNGVCVCLPDPNRKRLPQGRSLEAEGSNAQRLEEPEAGFLEVK